MSSEVVVLRYIRAAAASAAASTSVAASTSAAAASAFAAVASFELERRLSFKVCLIIVSIEPSLVLDPPVFLLVLSFLMGYLCIPEPNVRWLYRCPEKTEL